MFYIYFINLSIFKIVKNSKKIDNKIFNIIIVNLITNNSNDDDDNYV